MLVKGRSTGVRGGDVAVVIYSYKVTKGVIFRVFT